MNGATAKGMVVVVVALLLAGCGISASRSGQCGGISVAELRMVPSGDLPAMVLTADGQPIPDPRAPFQLSPGVHKLKFVIDGKRHLLYGNFSPPGRYVIEIRGEPGEKLIMELRPA